MTRADLSHPTRGRILAYLSENPGASLSEVARYLGVHRNAVAHHIRILSSYDKVQQRRQGRRALLFPAAYSNPRHQDLLGLVRQSTSRDILAALAIDPTVSWRALAQALGVTPHTVRWHIQRLETMGLMQLDRHFGGHRAQLHPTAWQVLESEFDFDNADLPRTLRLE